MGLMQNHGLTVYLKMHPKSLAQRLTQARRLRPVIMDIKNNNMQEFVETQLSERELFYNQANVIVKGENFDLVELLRHLPANS